MRDKGLFFEQAARARGEVRRGRGAPAPDAVLIVVFLIVLYLLGAACGAWP